MSSLLLGSVATPLGEVFVLVRGGRIVSVRFGEPPGEPVAPLARPRPTAPAGAGPSASGDALRASALRQIAEYFAGRRRAFDLELDLSELSPFQRRVLEAVQAIPWGRVLTYGEVAEAVGMPRAARAVGGVMSGNPLPLLVPCHRVVASGERLGGFGANLSAKAHLLALEGIRVQGPLEFDARLVFPGRTARLRL